MKMQRYFRQYKQSTVYNIVSMKDGANRIALIELEKEVLEAEL